jgi:hypothetical protein
MTILQADTMEDALGMVRDHHHLQWPSPAPSPSSRSCQSPRSRPASQADRSDSAAHAGLP